MCRGLGVTTWAVGNRHEGQYKDDKRNGTGVYTNADGQVYSSFWINDKENESKRVYM